jgi:hypothetical protein
MDCSSPPASSRYRRGGLYLREVLDDGRLELSLWPSRIYALPVALFTLLWLRFLWRWYALVSVTSESGARGFLLVFGLPFLLAGMSLIGTSLRLVVGRTSVRLDALRLHVADEAVLGRHPPLLVMPAHEIAAFAAESSSRLEDDRELDSWHVSAVRRNGESIVLPLPVRTMAEAELVARRLDTALHAVRAPQGYRS